MKFFKIHIFAATREQAYVYAIGSASLVYTMAKACSSGTLPHCTCSNEPDGMLPNEEFKWGGCADNVKWGMKFAKRFIDTIEKYNLRSNHHHHHHQRKLINVEMPLNEKKLMKIRSYMAAMNLHNNRIGRKVIYFY